MALKIRKLTPLFGAELRGVDIATGPDDATLAEIRAAFETYSVLVLPDQDLDDERQIDFSRRCFGALETHHAHAGNRDTHDMIARISNVDAEGNIMPADDPRMRFRLGNRLWHADSSFKKVPSLASLLHAREVVPEHGQTELASMRAAYAALPEERRAMLDGRTVIHYHRNSRRHLNFQVTSDDEAKSLPPVEHALVRANPVNGHKALFIGSHAATIPGMPEVEARLLLEDLLAFATRPQFVYSHQWRRGDLLIYDNRCVLHRARPYAWTAHRRIMHRTTVAGDGPTVAAAAE